MTRVDSSGGVTAVGAAALATPLGAGEEFDAIRRMAVRWGARASGLGDDAAVLTVPRGDLLVTSVDSAIEGRHFRREWLSDREIGYRAVTAALSDLAAMAATPLGALVALTVPERWRSALDAIADGIYDALTAADTVILGGNLSDGVGLSITTTVLGHAFAPLRRSGAKPGDHVYLTGALGGAGAAVEALEAGRSPTADWRARFAAPMARLREARWLASNGATAAIDISDGLVAELGHVAAASRVQIHVDAADLPCIAGVSQPAALGSGEEYELIVCASVLIDTAAFSSRFGIPLTRIGGVADVGEGSAGVTLTNRGRAVSVPRGHDHFSS